MGEVQARRDFEISDLRAWSVIARNRGGDGNYALAHHVRDERRGELLLRDQHEQITRCRGFREFQIVAFVQQALIVASRILLLNLCTPDFT